MSEFTSTLVIQVHYGPDTSSISFVNAAVQLWREDVHVTTIKVLEFADYDAASPLDESSVEQYATKASRLAARLIDEKLFERIKVGGVHSYHDLEKEFPTPAVKQD